MQPSFHKAVRAKVTNLISRLSVNIWMIPLLMMLAGIVAALVLIRVDLSSNNRMHEIAAMFGPRDVEGSLSLLSSLSASLITVVGVSFSVIVVVLTLASNQFGPRLLRNFMKDRITQSVIGVIMACFTFIIVVISEIERPDGVDAFPQVAISTAVAFTIVAIFSFVYLIHHIAQSIRVKRNCKNSTRLFFHRGKFSECDDLRRPRIAT